MLARRRRWRWPGPGGWRERSARAGVGDETVTERAPMGPGGHALHASCRAVAGWLVQWARVGSAMHACMFDRSAAPLRTTQLASLPLFPKGILRRAVEGRTANARVTGRDRTYCIYLTTGIPATLSVRRSADLHNVISHRVLLCTCKLPQNHSAAAHRSLLLLGHHRQLDGKGVVRGVDLGLCRHWLRRALGVRAAAEARGRPRWPLQRRAEGAQDEAVHPRQVRLHAPVLARPCMTPRGAG